MGQGDHGDIKYSWCDYHAKRRYSDKNEAKKIIRGMRPRKKGMRVYPCSEWEGFYHIGTLPLSVRQGRITEAEWWKRYGKTQEPNAQQRAAMRISMQNRIEAAAAEQAKRQSFPKALTPKKFRVE